MNTIPESLPTKDFEHSKLANPDEASLLWDEYKYRHDLIWRHIIRSTVVLVTLLTVRYTKEFGDNLYLSLIAWTLAFVYILFTFFVVNRELHLFNQIKHLHRKRQKAHFGLFSEHNDDQKTATTNFFDKFASILDKFFERLIGESFSQRVMGYLTVLLLLVILAGPIRLCNDGLKMGFAC